MIGIQSVRSTDKECGLIQYLEFGSMSDCVFKGDVTRNDSQRRFLAQHSITTLLRRCF